MHPDPRTACFYARRALELAVAWAYKHDAALQAAVPGQPQRADPRADASSRPPARRSSARRGSSTRSATTPCTATAPIPADRRADRGARAVPRLLLARPHLRPRGAAGAGPGLRRRRAAQGRAGRRSRRSSSCSSWKPRCASATRSSSALLADKTALDEELKRLRAEVAAAKKANAAAARHARLLRGRDPRLLHRPAAEGGRLAARPAARPRVRSQPACPTTRARASSTTCCGATTASRSALVEAKRTDATPRVGQQQAKLYADCLEQQFGQRPVIFYSNGYEHWLWDDANYPPRAVQGFYKKAELELLIQRRTQPQAAGRRPRSTQPSSSATTRRAPSAASARRSSSDHDRKALRRDGDRRGQDAHGDRARATC